MRIIQKGYRLGSLNKAVIYRNGLGELKIAVKGKAQSWVCILKGKDSETVRKHFVGQFL